MNPERWLVLEVRAPAEDLAPDIIEELVALGGAAVEERAAWLVTYLRPPPDAEALVESVRLRLEDRLGEGLDVRWRWRADEDWAQNWKRGLAPRRVGERIVVTPSWVTPDAGAADIVIVVDPEMAFGTGEHATTRGVLRLMQPLLGGGERVLDVGTGTGILAIAAARLGAAEVLGLESDADAVETAMGNIARNEVADRVTVRQAVVDGDVLDALRPGSFDLVVANVLSSVLIPLLPALRGVLRPAAPLILAGILASEAAEVTAAARRAGLAVVREDREQEWWSVVLRRS